jgi:ATPases of the AAA+ class
MHSLVGRAETVFSRATMICYYRIVRELYFAEQPDWIIGAARANAGGDASAFVTSECIRAILAFENAIIHTVAFFKNTRELSSQHKRLQGVLDGFGAGPEHPLKLWCNKTIERLWLDWYISTNPRRGEIAVKQVLTDLPEELNMESVGAYLDQLPAALELYVTEAKGEIKAAGQEIDSIRGDQNPYENGTEKPFKVGYGEEEERVYQRTESAHKVAYRAVWRGITETAKAQSFFENHGLDAILAEFVAQFEDISRRIHRILEPAKRYVRGVVNRELALATTESGRFDPGELAFAAASFGVTTDWRKNERLTMACELLTKNLPDSGSLPTRRAFHSNTRGYRLMPIGCEMTRSFAQLLQRANYAFEPKLVRRMLNIFEEKSIPASLPSQKVGQGQSEKRIAWNFEGAPHPERPCVWVTAVAVLALDRIVRMLNERINAVVLKHFEVIRPENPHTNLGLNDLLYPDYGLSEINGQGRRSIAIRLEQMRAHVERAMLPRAYKGKGGKMEKVFSVILYGPPGTGKTTLVEALALSSHAPLIRLSPSDLTVQGHELIEGRARAVFEALSMLTQAVIILDEFEPVLRDRSLTKVGAGSKADDPIFNFLVTGMLPKLIKLNDAAKRQSLVYCLATNFVEKIDNAAKRPGRFDLPLPVYSPDPLSRAGEFLYRAVPPPEAHAATGGKDREREMRLLEMVIDTAYTPAGELAEVYFKSDEDSAYYEYYWTGGAKEYKVKERQKLNPNEEGLSDDERTERQTIKEWEGKVKNPPVNRVGGGSDAVAYCLAPPGKEI